MGIRKGEREWEVNLKLAWHATRLLLHLAEWERRKGQLSKFLGIGTLICNAEHSDNTLHGKHVDLFMNHVL